MEIQQRPLWILTQPQLHQIGFGVGLHLGGAQLHPGGALAGGVADAGGEVANNKNGGVARILEGPQLAEQDRVAKVDVGAGGVDAQFHPQRPAGGLGLRQPSRQRLVGGARRFRASAQVGGGEQIGHPPLQPGGQIPGGLAHRACGPPAPLRLGRIVGIGPDQPNQLSPGAPAGSSSAPG